MADFDVNISDGIGVEVVITPSSEAGAGVSDHGALTGLSDDDHTQYHNNARGDARYSQLGHSHLAAAIDDFVSAVASAIPSSVATDAEVATAISTAINNLIDSAPGTLDTLAEIAAALEDDEDALAALSTAVNARLTQAQADVLYSALGHTHAYADITGKPSTFTPSSHGSSHKGDGADPIANATQSVGGLESAADKTKLDNIEAGATADQSAAEILTAIISGDPADGDFFEWDEASGRLVPVDAPSGGSGYRTLVTLSSDVTNSTTTVADVTGLSFSVTSGTIYRFHVQLIFAVANTAHGSAWGIDGPASPTLLSWVMRHNNGANTSTYQVWSGPFYGVGTTAASHVALQNLVIIEGIIQPSTTGTLVVRFAAEVGGQTVTAKAGSTLEYW